MQCGICERGFNSRRKRFCASCARATLYARRVEQAAALLDREKSYTHVEAVVRPGNDGVLAALSEDADWDAILSGIKAHSVEQAQEQIKIAEARVKDVARKADLLRQRIANYKTLAEKQKETNEQRRKELVTEQTQLDEQKRRALESVQLNVKKTRHRLEKVHKRTFEARDHLCREASFLSGLKRVKTEDGKHEYRLSAMLLPDLRDLNGINGKIKIETVDTGSVNKNLSDPHEIISASLDNVCRFLGICCHYLSIRLPFEIILPRGDFPHAAILPRDSSYRTSSVRYPGTTSSRTASPAASRVLPRTDLSRPRLLQLDRPIPQLQKEDPKTALFFLEGVVFLAYNIAWLCRSQGMESLNTFAEISAIGSNLYHLFAGRDGRAHTRPVLTRNISAATAKTERSSVSAPDSKPHMGMRSHDSAQHSLSGHEGVTLFTHESWPVSVTRLTDQLKSYLRHETARAEWHIVDDTEWDEELENERPVLIGGARRPPNAQDPAMSVLSVRPSDGTDEADLPVREKGASGWMKIRGRGGDE